MAVLGEWVPPQLADVLALQRAEEPEIAAHVQRSGLYQSLYSFQDARERKRRWGPLEHGSVLVMQKGSTEDLGLWLMEVPGGLEGGLNYNVDLFEPATVRMLVERLLGLLERAAQSPAATLRELLDAPGADAEAFAQWIDARRAAAPTPTAAAGAAAPAAASDGADGSPCRESEIARIWAGLLGMEPEDIGPTDNFLDLGGSSLLFMRALAQMDAELGLKVEPRRLLGETLRQLAADGAATPAAARR